MVRIRFPPAESHTNPDHSDNFEPISKLSATGISRRPKGSLVAGARATQSVGNWKLNSEN
jgi:hypothetical protein